MKDRKKQDSDQLFQNFLIFLILQPFLSLLSLEIFLAIDALVLVVSAANLFVKLPHIRHRWGCYLGLYLLFCLVHSFLFSPFKVDDQSNILLAMMGMFLLLLMNLWYLYEVPGKRKERYESLKKTVVLVFLEYSFLYILARGFQLEILSITTYLEPLFIMGFPFLLYYEMEQEVKWYSKLLVGGVFFLVLCWMSTRASIITIMITCVFYILTFIYRKIGQRKITCSWFSILLPISCLIIVGFLIATDPQKTIHNVPHQESVLSQIHFREGKSISSTRSYDPIVMKNHSFSRLLFGNQLILAQSEIDSHSDWSHLTFGIGWIGVLLLLILPLIEWLKATFYFLIHPKKMTVEIAMIYASILSFVGLIFTRGSTITYLPYLILLGVFLVLLKMAVSLRNGPRVMFISSTGGHFEELSQLSKLFKKYDSFIITERTKSVVNLKKKYGNNVGYLIFGTKDHRFTYGFKLLANCFISSYYYFSVRPSVVVTTGAHTAGPMCCLAKLFGSKVVYIETIANHNTKTATGRLLYYISDLFIVQWEEMLELYPKATYGGWIY